MMTVTIQQEHIYIAVILFLMIMQISLHRAIKKLEQDNEKLWDQMASLLANMTNRLMELQRDISNKQDKETK